MKKTYVQPEMEIDVFEENSGLIMTASGCPCDGALAYGEGEDPWGD